MSWFKELEVWVEKHNHHISPVILSLIVVLVLGLISPTLLLAQSLSPLPTMIQPNIQQPTNNFGSSTIFCDALGSQTTKDQCDANNSRQQPQQNQPPQNMMGGGDNQGGNNEGKQPGQNFNSPGQNGQQSEAQAAQQLKSLKSNVSRMNSNIKNFQKQLDRLTKQKLTIPSDVVDILKQATTAISDIQSATTLDDAQSSLSDFQDAMQSLQMSQQTIQQLSRWPQTLKQVDTILKNLNRQLKQDKIIATRLAKTNLDISNLVTDLTNNIASLQSARDQAIVQITTDPESAFTTLEDDFFGNMSDAQQSDQLIKSLSNLSRFASDYKRGLAQAQSTIASLKRKQIDTSDLASQLVTLKEKADAVQTLLKAKPLDPEEVMSALADLDTVRQDFQTAVEDLTGGTTQPLPWQQGASSVNFNNLNTNNLNQFMPQNNSFGSGPMGDDKQQPMAPMVP